MHGSIPAALLAAAVNTSPATSKIPDRAELERLTARFKPVEISADLSRVPVNERAVLAKLVQAARIIDALFLRQVWAGNQTLMFQLAQDWSPLGRARLHAFVVNKGPWSRLDKNAPFIPGVPAKPEGGNFYPPGATKEEVERWLHDLDDATRATALNFFTVIRWSATLHSFEIVPYNLEYQPELRQAAQLLREAANLTGQQKLKDYLSKRARAFETNDYYESDLAWMELDSTVEPTIGPYEVYEDEWFNAKAAFEGFLAVRDEAETQKLARFGAELQDIEDHLPIEPSLRNPKLGALAPIRVVNELFAAGDGNRGVQTAAFNLPNDERITKEKGTKRVMLKNVQEAKFKVVLRPIAEVALAANDRKNVTFDAFFTHILMHELMHGLGPHNISVSNRATTVRQELRDTYSAIEEAKADISGLFALQHLIDKGVIDRAMERTIYVTFLASAFRSIRFGLTEAHGKGIALQLNYLLDFGAFKAEPEGTFSVDGAKIKQGVAALTGELMTIEARGDQAKARAMLQKLAVARPEVQRVLDRLKAVPVDIEPKFTTAEKLQVEFGSGAVSGPSGQH
jgi:hypothetical protein